MSLAASLERHGADLAERACAGEPDAVAELVKAMQRPFYNLALRMLSDRAAAEDAVQECLLRVITHLSEFRAEARFATWATRIAVNAILDYRSGVARQARYGFEAFAAGLAEGRDDAAVERPEDALVLKEAKTLCSRALLQCLDGDHRIAFVLGEILEFEANDAAQILDVEPATYRKRLSRARAEVTTVLSRECSVHTAGAACACHRRLPAALRSGQLDPSALESKIGDLEVLRRRLAVLQSEARTSGMYQADEVPDVRDEVLSKLRSSLFRMSN
jgi:RNA polymerase sigma factor (sigma-70 family)